MNWYWVVLTKYADTSGRARRAEFWYFVLINTVIVFALSFVDNVLGFFYEEIGVGVLSGIYSLLMIIPYLTVTIRRLHDTGRSGWWLLIQLIPGLGGLVMFIFMLLDSQHGTNQYGSDPKIGQPSGSILLFIVLVIFFIGILASIAIPAYQAYVLRVNPITVNQSQSI